MCNSKHVNAVDAEPTEEEQEILITDSVTFGTINQNNKSPHNAKVQFWHEPSSHSIQFKLDTGSEANVLSLAILKSFILSPITLQRSNQMAYGGTMINCLGTILLDLTAHGVNHRHISTNAVIWVITWHTHVNQISATTDLQDCIQKHKSTFTGIGKRVGLVHIVVKPDIHPVVHHPRRVLFSITKGLKKELDRLVGLHIISKVMTPTEWVNSMVAVEKKIGSICLCLDSEELK